MEANAITAAQSVQALSGAEAPRALPDLGGAAAASRPQVGTDAQVFGTRRPAEAGLADLIDKMRADFSMKQWRIDQSPNSVSAASRQKDASTRMSEAMERSMQLQVDLFRTAIGMHAGISASQQSQGGVKTLVEKS